MRQLTIAFIGLGLIGGSIAKSLRLHEPSITIYAYDSNKECLALALKDQTINKALTTIEETTTDASGKSCYCLSQCDLIFLCAPVSTNNNLLSSLKEIITPSTILTDVGSVKSGIHKVIEDMGLSAQFVGGHPMTGSEKSGFANAQALILENAYYILTPTKDSPKEGVSILKELIELTGAIPIVVDAQKHDYITAAISHVPHLIAAALVNLVKASDSSDGMMKTLAAGGFKDITRIASSSPEMWEAICMSNPDNITSLLDDYIASLENIRSIISTNQTGGIHQLFEESRTYRDSFQDSSHGSIQKSFVLLVDIPDVTGSIATLATILASHAISIKNIGIIHNREFDEGVLKIEFYDITAKADALALLTKLQYTVFDRK